MNATKLDDNLIPALADKEPCETFYEVAASYQFKKKSLIM